MTKTSIGLYPTAEDALEQLRYLEILPSLVAESHKICDNVINEAREIMVELETPAHTIARMLGTNPWESITIDTAAEMGLFRALEFTRKPVTARQIAEFCNAELLLVQRLLRVLVVFSVVREHRTGTERHYSPTNVSSTFSNRNGEAAIRFCSRFAAPAWMRLPDKLKSSGYRYLTSGNDTVFNKQYNMPGKTCWEILSATPWVEDAGLFMAGFNAGHVDWLKFYPVQERLVHGASEQQEAVFMVDIGWLTGSQAVALREQFKSVTARFVVQDLPATLSNTPPAGIELMGHNFFEPQPIIGARLYYMRYISHDWSQEAFIKILAQIKPAMKPGYSKLIIHDWIVPENNVPPFMATQDLNMMSLGGGEERTENRFREAVEQSGLVVSGIWDPKDGVSEVIIECEALC